MEILLNKELLNNLDDREKTAVQWQRGILIVAFIIGLPLVWLSYGLSAQKQDTED